MTRICALLALIVASAIAPAAAVAGEASLPAHLELDIDLEPAARRLRATAQFRAEEEVTVALHRSLQVSAVWIDGRRSDPEAVGESGDLRGWRVRARRGASVRLEYEGTLPALDRALDHRSVLKLRAPMASSAGSFLPSGSGWYPGPSARFSYRVKLTLPGEQRGLVAGRLEEETLPADKAKPYQAVFHFAQPAEGIDLMAGPYRVQERLVSRSRSSPLRLRTYFFSGMEPLAEGYLDASERYITLYSEMIGAYPFSEFSIVASPLPTGFGMPSLTYIGADVLKLPFIRATSLGHEVLHNWWGNGVSVDYSKGNWSEGLTTFMADYFYKEQESAAAAREMRVSWLRDFAAVPDHAHRPLSAFRSRTHGAEAALGYGKAAMVFFMLRDEIGEEAFRRGIQHFWNTHRFKVASWDELRGAFEEVTGRSLSPFFDQWVKRSGGPQLEISEARLRSEGGQSMLAVTVKQSPPPYSLRVPLEWVAEGRAASARVEVNREHQVVTLKPDAIPRGVRLDPDFRVWRRLEQEALPPILRQWIIARSPRVAIVSAAESVQRAAHMLAQRFFESPARPVSAIDLQDREPLLIVGLHADVERALAASGLPQRPAAVADRGTAQLWTIQRTGSAPVAVISARDADSLAALARPLPHYGSQSYLAFEGSRVITRGVWPAQARLIPVER